MDRRGDVLANVATRLHVSDVLFGCSGEGKPHIQVTKTMPTQEMYMMVMNQSVGNYIFVFFLHRISFLVCFISTR